jgi:hypothetical protein
VDGAVLNERDDTLLHEMERLRERVIQLEADLSLNNCLWDTLRAREKAQRALSRRLAELVETMNELTALRDEMALCRRAVELGRERLGFERLGIWFTTDAQGVYRGSYGVDMQGRVIDERGETGHVDPESPEGRLFRGREPFVRIASNRIGEQALVPFWDQGRLFGHMSTDNALSRRPLSDDQFKLFHLFANAVGVRLARIRTEHERQRLYAELENAARHIEQLHALIPICAGCKKVRDDGGFWRQVEEYVHEHFDADFSHSLCPECLQRLYPEYAGGDGAPAS